jgi:twitching motility protein PilU
MSSGTMERILRLMAEKKASDVYLSAHAPAMIKINGQTIPINSQVLPPEAPRNLLAEIVPATRIEELVDTGELNMAVPLDGVGNFRVSAFRQRSHYAVVIRYVPGDIPALESAQRAPILADLVMEKRGLVHHGGRHRCRQEHHAGAMIDHRNERTTGHILTVEDPIEYVYRNKKSVVNQRELGTDTASLQIALKNALRQAPDVILIGEIRDRETMSPPLPTPSRATCAWPRMHANNSYQALNRILSFYPVEVRPTMLGDLAMALRSIVSQRLLRTHTGGRVPAMEVMLNTTPDRRPDREGDFSGRARGHGESRWLKVRRPSSRISPA